MSLLDIAKKRYSVRKYEDKPVEKEKLEKILEMCIRDRYMRMQRSQEYLMLLF